MDTNVPTESTYRLCDALIKAGKDFDFVMVPGAGHGMGGAYGQRRLQDFFVRHLQGVEPPDRNAPRQGGRGAADERAAAREEGRPPDEDEGAGATRPRGPDRQAAERGPVVARRFEADRGSLTRAYAVPMSPTRTARLTKFYADWLAALKAVDPDKLSQPAREELVALRGRVESERKELEARAAADAAIAPLVPFAETIVGAGGSPPADGAGGPGEGGRHRRRTGEAGHEAATEIEAGIKSKEFPSDLPATRKTAARAADAAESLRRPLRTWYGFYDGYDPLFTWWVADPYKQADAALDGYVKLLREQAAKLPDEEAELPKVEPPAPGGRRPVGRPGPDRRCWHSRRARWSP